MSISRRNGKKTREYRVWESMVGRCRDKGHTAYPRYGGRGIRVALEWSGRGGFVRFMAYMGPKPSPRHTIERIDNKRGYEPGNVRWATYAEQGRNKCNNVLATLAGETRTLNDWCARLREVSDSTAYVRVERGWSPEASLVTPPRQREPLTGRFLRMAIEAAFSRAK